MTSENSMGPADFAAMMGNNGNGFGNWGDGSFWIIILFLFAMFGNNGWNNGNNGGYGGGGYVPAMQNGFDQAAVMGGLNTINSNLGNGFATAEISACGRAADAMQTAYTNQIATMNQNFAAQTALNSQLNGIQSNLQQCCCNNAALIEGLKYSVATENCADRAAISDGIRDLLTAQNANTQRILDVMCQDKIDAKNERIQELTTQINMMNLAASQNAQTAALIANNEAQTNALERYLAPNPIPAYVVQNPNCCSSVGYNGCGCSMA